MVLDWLFLLFACIVCFLWQVSTVFLYTKKSVPVTIILFPKCLSILKLIFDEFGGVCKRFHKGSNGVCHTHLVRASLLISEMLQDTNECGKTWSGKWPACETLQWQYSTMGFVSRYSLIFFTSIALRAQGKSCIPKPWSHTSSSLVLISLASLPRYHWVSEDSQSCQL